MSDQIGHTVFAVLMIFFSTAFIAALFSDSTLAQFRWKGSRWPLSRFSILLILPFFLYFAAKMSVLAMGREWPCAVPMWAFLLYFGVFVICQFVDRLRRRKERP